MCRRPYVLLVQHHARVRVLCVCVCVCVCVCTCRRLIVNDDALVVIEVEIGIHTRTHLHANTHARARAHTQLVSILNRLFGGFDDLCDQHGCYKVPPPACVSVCLRLCVSARLTRCACDCVRVRARVRACERSSVRPWNAHAWPPCMCVRMCACSRAWCVFVCV